MSAPKGNEFFKLRTRHGRNKLFPSADFLWQAACNYFEWCEQNPFVVIDFRGRGGKRVEITKPRPFTLAGLCIFLNCNTQYFSQLKKRLSEDNERFFDTIKRIEQIIYTQKFEGAAVGVFNANLIARDLALKNKQEVQTILSQIL